MHSITMSTPSSLHGSFEGSFSASTLIGPKTDIHHVAFDFDLAMKAAMHAVDIGTDARSFQRNRDR